MKINKAVGERIAFTGGHEVTPEVQVVWSVRPERETERVLRIEQDGAVVLLSGQTLAEIMSWAQRE
jgi:hypothetical protein